MAVHFPTDHYVFACVLTAQKDASPKDSGLLRECQKRIPGFIASRELDQTLINLLRLEEKLGKKIDWVAATEAQHKPGMITDDGWHPKTLTYDSLIAYKKALPNRSQRSCTEQLKIYAIFWHVFLHVMQDEDPVFMNIGFRWDEGSRVEDLRDRCDKVAFPYKCGVDAKSKRSKHVWRNLEWRVLGFPMYEAKISRMTVERYWLEQGWVFPQVSNCDGCFHHTPKELRIQNELFPERMAWWAQQEANTGVKWKSSDSYDDLLNYVEPPDYQGSLFDILDDKKSACFCGD